MTQFSVRIYITSKLTFHEGNKNFIGLVLGNILHN